MSQITALPIEAFDSTHPSTDFDNLMDIQDNLDSTATNKPLSANQGKILNDKVSSVDNFKGIPLSATMPTVGQIYTYDGTNMTPTNYIDSGSNINGEYIKFPDGTMICKISKASPVGSSANGNGYISGATNWTFPVEFISRPIVLMSADRIVSSGANPTGVTRASSADFSKTAIDNIFVWYNQASSTVQTEIAFQAIGRWK